jgi:maltose operon protein
MRLTPALGQQKIYVLVFTTEKDLQQTTKLIDPAKAYAKGTGNSVPDIPDPLARHVTDGLLKLKVSTNNASSVLVGPLFGSSGTGPVTVGNTAAPVYAAPAAAAPVAAASQAPAKPSEPVLNDTESYFNNAIKQAVKKGDVDKALKLLMKLSV